MFWRNAPRRKNSGLPPWGRRLVFVLAAACLFGAGLRGADKLQQLQESFDRETHAAKKVKELDKLGQAQFMAADNEFKSGHVDSAVVIFEKYRDNVKAAFELLRKQEPDVDKHSSGYRQLELGIREGLREVEDSMLVAPEPMQPPLRIVHKDLLEMDDALINLLFPRRATEPQKVPPAPEAKP
jgi:hypothetical protein